VALKRNGSPVRASRVIVWRKVGTMIGKTEESVNHDLRVVAFSGTVSARRLKRKTERR